MQLTIYDEKIIHTNNMGNLFYSMRSVNVGKELFSNRRVMKEQTYNLT